MKCCVFPALQRYEDLSMCSSDSLKCVVLEMSAVWYSSLAWHVLCQIILYHHRAVCVTLFTVRYTI